MIAKMVESKFTYPSSRSEEITVWSVTSNDFIIIQQDSKKNYSMEATNVTSNVPLT